jgi:hypothetical protein
VWALTLVQLPTRGQIAGMLIAINLRPSDSNME